MLECDDISSKNELHGKNKTTNPHQELYQFMSIANMSLTFAKYGTDLVSIRPIFHNLFFLLS